MGNFGILLRKGHVFETLCKVNHLVVDKTGTLTKGDIEISRTSTFKELSEAESLALASALEAHANHPLARSFTGFSNDEIIVTDVKNVIGSGIEG
ncbi:HAD family hydrolase, partial [Escherichia coli]|nr:HAD family hydrolase [Escherichia coli]